MFPGNVFVFFTNHETNVAFKTLIFPVFQQKYDFFLLNPLASLLISAKTQQYLSYFYGNLISENLNYNTSKKLQNHCSRV